MRFIALGQLVARKVYSCRGKSGGFHAGFGHERGPVRIVFPGEDIRNLRVSLPVCMAAYAFGRFFRLDNMLPVKSEVRPVFSAGQVTGGTIFTIRSPLRYPGAGYAPHSLSALDFIGRPHGVCDGNPACGEVWHSVEMCGARSVENQRMLSLFLQPSCFADSRAGCAGSSCPKTKRREPSRLPPSAGLASLNY